MLALQAWGPRALALRWEMLVWCHVLITPCREWRREDPGQCWPALLAYLGTLGQWDPVSEQGGLLLLRNDIPGCPLTFTRDAGCSHVHAHTHRVPFLYFSFSLNASSGSPGNGCISKLQTYCLSPTVFRLFCVILRFIFSYMCTSVYCTCECRCSQTPEEGVRPNGTGVIGSWILETKFIFSARPASAFNHILHLSSALSPSLSMLT